MQFCGKCGAQLDEQTGLCPNCSQKEQIQPEAVTPVVQQFVAEKPAPKKAKKASVLTTVISVIGAICLALTLISALVVYTVQSVAKGNSGRDLLEGVDMVEVLSDAGIYTRKDAKKFANYINDEFDTDVTVEDIDDLMSRISLEELVDDKVTNFVADFDKGGAEIVLTRRDIVKFLEDNKKTIDRKLDVDMQDEDMERVADWIMESSKEDAEIVLLDAYQLKQENSGVYYGVKLLLSESLLWILIVFSLLAVCLLLFNNLKQGSGVVGGVYVVFGALSFVPAAVVLWLDVIWEMLAGSFAYGALIGNILVPGLVPGAALLCVGIALLVARKIIRNQRKGKVAAV